VPRDVSVIIASHNTRVEVEHCLAAFGDTHELIVVDTGSADGSQELVRERCAVDPRP
jgi:GT2 family glycosyltransferase